MDTVTPDHVKPESDNYHNSPSRQARESLKNQMCEFFDMKPSDAEMWIHKIREWAKEAPEAK
jgi:hypothetical protein